MENRYSTYAYEYARACSYINIHILGIFITYSKKVYNKSRFDTRDYMETMAKMEKNKANTTAASQKISHILKLFAIWKLIVLQEKRARHRMWVRPIFSGKKKLLHGANENLVKEFEDHKMFYNYCRKSVKIFNELWSIVGLRIEKQYIIRDPISTARIRLLICLLVI